MSVLKEGLSLHKNGWTRAQRVITWASQENFRVGPTRSQSVRIGVTIPSADTPRWTLALRSLVGLCADYRSSDRVHLTRHTRSEVVRSYLRVLESAARFASRATHADQSLHE
jgi:hypothetical protein